MHFNVFVCVWTGIPKHARIDFNVAKRLAIASEKWKKLRVKKWRLENVCVRDIGEKKNEKFEFTVEFDR